MEAYNRRLEHITYDVLDDYYGTDAFTDPTIKGRLGVNAMRANKHLYDHITYDSTGERDFAAELEKGSMRSMQLRLTEQSKIHRTLFGKQCFFINFFVTKNIPIRLTLKKKEEPPAPWTMRSFIRPAICRYIPM